MNAPALPKIVRFLEIVEGGACPHCGSGGRWIHRFVVADGRELGAMSGCVKLFPVSPVAREHQRLMKKARDYEKKGWKLNRWDSESLDAIEAFYVGAIDERSALATVQCNKQAASNWRQIRYRRVP